MSVSEIAGTPLSIGMDLSSIQHARQPGSADAGMATPRAVEPGCAQQFREMLTSAAPCEAHASPLTPPTSPAATPLATQSATPAGSGPAGAINSLDLDIEKMVMSHLPSADATPAEFALGMLRAQVKVSQAAVGIQLVAKTTQSLSQGVQALTSRG